MVTFIAPISKSGSNGWSYIIINKKLAKQLKPTSRSSFRVKGMLDNHPIQKTSLLPVKEGRFMLPINAGIRKATGKQAGDKLKISLEVDDRKLTLSADLIKCLKDDPQAMKFFKSLSPSNQRYYSKWIDGAKTAPTKTKRLVICLIALGKKMNYTALLQNYKSFEI